MHKETQEPTKQGHPCHAMPCIPNNQKDFSIINNNNNSNKALKGFPSRGFPFQNYTIQFAINTQKLKR